MNQHTRKNALIVSAIILAVGLCWTAAPAAWAGDDPSIQGELRTNIHAAMQDFVKAQRVNGVFYQYDPVDGQMLRLHFKNLHSGIVKKGEFYVSCADFTDQHGRLLDLDFLVVPDGEKLRTTQAIVHAVDGTKRPYHVEAD